MDGDTHNNDNVNDDDNGDDTDADNDIDTTKKLFFKKNQHTF